MQDPSNEVILMGSATPDAFAFTTSAFQYLAVCPPMEVAVQLHNLEFAGYMVQQVKKHINDRANGLLVDEEVGAAEADDNLLDFTHGFGSHMIGDYVGFFDKGGYLSSGYKTKFGNINWLTMQPRMQSIDAFILDSLGLTKNQSYLPQKYFSTNTAEFVSTATAGFSPSHPGFPSFNSSVISDCTASWIDMVKRLYNYYVHANPKETYIANMIYFDQQNAGSFDETKAYFMKNALCSSTAISSWGQDIGSGTSPAKAVDNVEKLVQQFYGQGMCS